MIIATVGPQGGHGWQASLSYDGKAEILVFPSLAGALGAVETEAADRAVIPVYNTREGEIKEYFQAMENATRGVWIDNIVMPIQLSLGCLDERRELSMLVGTSAVFRQCEQYIASHHPDISCLSVKDLDKAIDEISAQNKYDWGVVDSEDFLKAKGLRIRERELAAHNRTRFAVIGREPNPPTGYDATAIITAPLKDRVGLLYDILGEFSKRGINLLDIRSETDIKTQELKIYIEAEGHIQDKDFQTAIKRIETTILQERKKLKPLGSYRRVEIRTKRIENFGFIGTGDMSQWFAKKLENEGYKTILTGRSSARKPEEMIPQVNVVVICVPISATSETVKRYGPLLSDGQALILLAGEAEDTLDAAMSHTSPGVEVMLVHNLWGPQAVSMKDRLASVVRTPRSGAFCSEFESFLYKHGAEISHDRPEKHDLLMGVSQKLPTSISVALAATLSQNSISPKDFCTHSTLTSLYGILAMSRVHFQNPRTYAEIMSTKGEGRKIVHDFIENLRRLVAMADGGEIEDLEGVISGNRAYLTDSFLQEMMAKALMVDQNLGKIGRS